MGVGEGDVAIVFMSRSAIRLAESAAVAADHSQRFRLARPVGDSLGQGVRRWAEANAAFSTAGQERDLLLHGRRSIARRFLRSQAETGRAGRSRSRPRR